MTSITFNESALVWTAVVVASILVVYVNWLIAGLQRLDAVTRALLSGALPSAHVQHLARLPDGGIAAMTAYRAETGADVRLAMAVVRTLRSRAHRRSEA